MDFSSQISKMTQYKKLRTLASIRHANNSPRTGLSNSIVSAIDFDKDGELFATAGVSKVIQIYQLSNVIETSKIRNPLPSMESSSKTQSSLSSAIFVDESESEQENFDPDEHTSIATLLQREETPQQYPIIELKTSAKISSMSWNRYILPHLISSDYEGAITLWDVSQSKQLCRFSEHERRTWSCHFNPINPTMFASGGDDSKGFFYLYSFFSQNLVNPSIQVYTHYSYQGKCLLSQV
jgi:E3 ubiquitin-protein ligase RFWD2